MVGSRDHNLSTSDVGAAYLYPWDGSSYNTTTGVEKSQEALPENSAFGHAVAVSPDGSTLCVTAPAWDGATHGDQGTAFIYR